MFVVTAEFQIRAGCEAEFTGRVRQQASDSLKNEEHCHRFDVCSDGGDRIFLYELYSDEAAFEHHKETAHFKSFAADVEPWVQDKTVRTFTLMD